MQTVTWRYIKVWGKTTYSHLSYNHYMFLENVTVFFSQCTKIFQNSEDNEYDRTTLIPALHLLIFNRFFVDTGFGNFFTLSIILTISRKLQQVPDHIKCPSCVAYPINSDIRLIRVSGVAAGYPIISGDDKIRLDEYPTRPEHRVPEFIGYPHTPNSHRYLFEAKSKQTNKQLHLATSNIYTLRLIFRLIRCRNLWCHSTADKSCRGTSFCTLIWIYTGFSHSSAVGIPGRNKHSL